MSFLLRMTMMMMIMRWQKWRLTEENGRPDSKYAQNKREREVEVLSMIYGRRQLFEIKAKTLIMINYVVKVLTISHLIVVLDRSKHANQIALKLLENPEAKKHADRHLVHSTIHGTRLCWI